MTRCPSCHRAVAGRDPYCRHCGTMLLAVKKPFFILSEWLDGRHALKALAAAALVTGLRVLFHPLIMTYQGERHEGRVALFHVVMGLALGAVAVPLRKDSDRGWIWLGLGALGGGFSWLLDYTFMKDHLLSQAVFYVLNWLDSSPDSVATGSSYVVLQVLRFTGPLLFLGGMASWNASPGVKLKVTALGVFALYLRAMVKGYALGPHYIPEYPSQISLYFTSLFVFLYSLAPTAPKNS